MKLLSLKNAHLIGIKGQGMTALAELLVKNGVLVTGSDVDEVFTTDPVLQQLGIAVHEFFSPVNIPKDAGAVVYSMAFTPENNPELAYARTLSIPVLSYPEALGLLTEEKMTLAVSGSHGKTTTSALLAETLRYLKQDPSAIVGSQIHAWGGNALVGKGVYLVLEADEYQNKLKLYTPFGVILTSVDWDHPDFFPDPESYEKVFHSFVERIPRHGVLVACGDSSSVIRVTKSAQTTLLTYGFHSDNRIRIFDYHPIEPESELGKEGYFQEFFLRIREQSFGPIRLRLSGRHNALNATAVFALLSHFKYDPTAIVEALEHFSGTKRRFEKVGSYRGALVYDDFAHHPDEIRATLRAFRELYPQRRIRVVFHPHTYSRTKALFQEFSQAFEDADQVDILPIYGSAREVQGGVSSEELVAQMNQYAHNKAEFVSSKQVALETLRKDAAPDDLIVTMGAGDVWQIAKTLVK